jgi:hypothetical protein
VTPASTTFVWQVTAGGGLYGFMDTLLTTLSKAAQAGVRRVFVPRSVADRLANEGVAVGGLEVREAGFGRVGGGASTKLSARAVRWWVWGPRWSW